jgi:DNA-binding MarR family transcriptional regulator
VIGSEASGSGYCRQSARRPTPDVTLVAAHRVSLKEFEVLITLFNAPGGRLRMTDLAERALLTTSGLTHLVTPRATDS